MSDKISREQTEILLMEYAAGSLNDACSVMVASYISICPEARRYYQHCEELGGNLIEYYCQPVAMRGDSLERVLGKIGAGQEQQTEPDRSCQFCDQQDLPAPVKTIIKARRRQGRARWHRASPGIRYYTLPVESSGHSTMLIKMGPHARVPRHEHPGEEMTLVLEGGFHDEYGHYQAGDLVVIEQTRAHTPIAGPQGCLCLITTNLPVRFTGPFGKLLNLLTS